MPCGAAFFAAISACVAYDILAIFQIEETSDSENPLAF
jgi:hypothetical protein